MAKTSKTRDWTPVRLCKAVTAGTRREKVAVLKKIGVLTRRGKLAKTGKRWGKKPSRTPVLED
jgi:hypothetical protein